MRGKIKYQLLDPVSRTKAWTHYIYYVMLFLVTMFFIYALFGHRKGSSIPRANHPLPYEAVIKELQNEITNRNEMINELQKSFRTVSFKSNLMPVYRRRPETQHIDCGRVLRNDKNYIEQFSGDNRVTMVNTTNLDMACSHVSNRIIPTMELRSLAAGVAFARIVYTDYELIEDQVRASYHPQNVFCFAIDKKADKDFHERMKSLASCIPNIILLFEENIVDSSGHNVNKAHYNCLKALINKPGWNYAILLQNHDMIGKTVYELEKIYQIFGGANDVEITPEGGRINKKDFKWDAKSLKLFRNESSVNNTKLTETMRFAKGAAQGSLSRAAVEWMVETADLTTFIDQMNSGGFGVDEMFIQSLQISNFLGMPGQFTDKCLKQGQTTDFVSRMSQWLYGPPQQCASGVIRHAICMLGIGDIPTIAQFPNIMFNKMMPTFDVSAIDCLGELLYNRTFLNQTDHPLEESYYSNMVNVVYHKHHLEPGYKLNCTPPYQQWSKRKYPV